MSNILVIRGGAIGDFILTLPAIRLLREGLPTTPNIEILGYRPVIALAGAAGLADATRSMEHAALANFFVPGAKLDPQWMNYFRSFDVVVSYLFDPDGFFEANIRATGVETYIPWSGKVDPSLGIHASLQLAKPLESLALYLDDPAALLNIPPAAKTTTTTPGSPLFAVHPGSGSPSKNWGYENWIAVCSTILSELPSAHFLFVTGEAEHETLPALTALLDTAKIPHTSLHALPLTELAGHLTSASAFLGHDSGIGHLASALSLPSALVFGPTDPTIWAPTNPATTTIQAPDKNLASLLPPQVAATALSLISS